MARIDIDSRLDPQMAAALRKQAELAPGLGTMHDTPIAELRRSYAAERRFWNEDRPEVAKVVEGSVPGPVRDIPIRVYYPTDTQNLPGLIFLHGGGWVVGSLDTHDKIMRILALESGVAVVGVEYSLSPEHKFPTALEETLAVVRAFASNNDYGLDVERLAIGGDSAGANLSLATLHEFRKEGTPLFNAGLLYYGAYGLADSPSRRKFGGSEDGLSAQDLSFYRDCLVRSPEDNEDPRLNLLSQDLAGLPPLYIASAELDPLLDDSRLLAELAEEAGVPFVYEEHPGVLHGFLHLSRMVDRARIALDESGRWLASVI